ncbi:hypothetical protein JB92DRAFT_2884857 [Gautieria morchelliformis]|nr:hypothetical protein JB92DRAFT_2884857 [Gautieria morchelliformis]
MLLLLKPSPSVCAVPHCRCGCIVLQAAIIISLDLGGTEASLIHYPCPPPCRPSSTQSQFVAEIIYIPPPDPDCADCLICADRTPIRACARGLDCQWLRRSP